MEKGFEEIKIAFNDYDEEVVLELVGNGLAGDINTIKILDHL